MLKMNPASTSPVVENAAKNSSAQYSSNVMSDAGSACNVLNNAPRIAQLIDMSNRPYLKPK